MARLKMWSGTDTVKGVKPPKLFNVSFNAPERLLKEFLSVLKPAIQKNGFQPSDFQLGVGKALAELIADIEAAGDALTDNYDGVSYEGYRKFFHNKYPVRIKHDNDPVHAPKVMTIVPVDRKHLRSLPPIEGLDEKCLQETYADYDKLRQGRVAVSTRYIDVLMPIAKRFQINFEDLILQAMERYYLRKFLSTSVDSVKIDRPVGEKESEQQERRQEQLDKHRDKIHGKQ